MQSIIQIPTKYIFGENVVINNLGKELNALKIKKILLLYGGGSIKKNGVYDDIINSCKRENIEVVEFGGIEPNPKSSSIYKAGQVCINENVQLIIAAGGGSVIDAAKVVAVCATNKQLKSAWEYVSKAEALINKPLPIFSIITIAATGSESNFSSVITNDESQEHMHYKLSIRTPSAIPQIAFEDPKYTLSLSWGQTSSGAFDIFSHLLEQYYDMKHTCLWTKQYILANMKVVYKTIHILKNDLTNLEARSNLLWTSSWSLNGLAKFQTYEGDWTVHKLEHAISGLWDVTHGAGLALITPTYIKYQCKINPKFKQFTLEIANEIFNVKTLTGFFKKLNEFITFLELPKKYTDFPQIKNVTKENIDWLIKHYMNNMSIDENNDNKVIMAKKVLTSISV